MLTKKHVIFTMLAVVTREPKKIKKNRIRTILVILPTPYPHIIYYHKINIE